LNIVEDKQPKQTGPQVKEEDKPVLEDYTSKEPGKSGMKPKEPSDVED
jgi:hypothetical protein